MEGCPKTRLSLRGVDIAGLQRNVDFDLQRWILGGSPSAYGTTLTGKQADRSAQVAVQADVIAVRARRICSYKSREGAQIVLAPIQRQRCKVCGDYVRQTLLLTFFYISTA